MFYIDFDVLRKLRLYEQLRVQSAVVQEGKEMIKNKTEYTYICYRADFKTNFRFMYAKQYKYNDAFL